MSHPQFYKPNSKGTGHACSFDLQSSGDAAGVYLEIVKQTGWNAEKKLGSFKDGKKVKNKFNETEVANFLYAIRNNAEYSTFHTTEASKTGITFKPYLRDGKQIGFSLAISQGGTSYLVGFTNGETTQIEEWLVFALGRFNQAAYAEKKKKFSEAQGSK